MSPSRKYVIFACVHTWGYAFELVYLCVCVCVCARTCTLGKAGHLGYTLQVSVSVLISLLSLKVAIGSDDPKA